MPLDDQLREERDGNTLHLILPARKMGCFNVVGIILLVMSAISLFICFEFSYDSLRDFFTKEDDGFGKYFGLVFGIMGLIPGFVGLGLGLLGISIFIFKSYVRITVGDAFIKAREQLGPFHKSWLIKRDNLKSLQVMSAFSVTDKQAQKTTTSHFGIIARGKDGKDMRFAPGYSKELLERVVVTLSHETDAELLDTLIETPESLAANESASNPQDLPLPEQPSGSKIEWEDRPDGLAIRIPPAGLKKGSKGLWAFAIIWNAFVGLIYVGLAYAAIVNKDDEAWTGMLAMLIFLAVGVGILLGALNMGRRSADILLMNSMLTIKRKGIFGEKVKEFEIADIKKIADGPSGMEVNNKPVYELQVFNKENTKLIGLLSQIEDKELKWLAALLDRKLKILS